MAKKIKQSAYMTYIAFKISAHVMYNTFLLHKIKKILA